MRFVMGFALGILLTATAAEAQSPSCKVTMAASIDLKAQSNRLLIDTSFGGVPETLSLELENGSNGLSTTVVDALKLPTTMVPLNFKVVRQGREINRLTIAPLFRIGGLDLQKVEFLVLPSTLDVPGQAGDLGMAQFRNVDFELDVAHGKFNLFLPDHCPGGVVYWTTGPVARLPFTRDDLGYVNIALTLDGTKVRARLATSGVSLMGMNAARGLFHLDENSPGMTEISAEDAGIHLPGSRKYYRYAFKSLDGDGLAITNPEVFIYGENARRGCEKPQDNRNTQIPAGAGNVSRINLVDICFGTFDLSLSPTLLQKLRLYFSAKENLVYATAADAH